MTIILAISQSGFFCLAEKATAETTSYGSEGDMATWRAGSMGRSEEFNSWTATV